MSLTVAGCEPDTGATRLIRRQKDHAGSFKRLLQAPEIAGMALCDAGTSLHALDGRKAKTRPPGEFVARPIKQAPGSANLGGIKHRKRPY